MTVDQVVIMAMAYLTSLGIQVPDTPPPAEVVAPMELVNLMPGYTPGMMIRGMCYHGKVLASARLNLDKVEDQSTVVHEVTHYVLENGCPTAVTWQEKIAGERWAYMVQNSFLRDRGVEWRHPNPYRNGVIEYWEKP